MTKIQENTTPPVLVIGLGNPILGDDGVGWHVAEEVKSYLKVHQHTEGIPSYEIGFLSVGGLSLMERMIGYDNAIIIDASQTRKVANGTVSWYDLEELPNQAWGHLSSSHDTTLQNALQVGHRMNAHLPHQIMVVGIEAENLFEFSETLSPEVASAVPIAVSTVIQLLKKHDLIEPKRHFQMKL